MGMAPTTICALAALTFAGAASAQAQAVQRVGLASPWVELNSARVRLLAGPAAAKPGKAYLAGVEVTLADGWKTYWRMPGDAGVPPTFSWDGSSNVASVKVAYPAPSRMREPAAQTVGYKGSVLFPVEVVPKNAAKPVDLKLALELGICREICIPAEATISLTLQPSLLKGEPAPEIAAALEQVPRPSASRRAGDPELMRATASLEGPAPRLYIEARFPRGAAGADLFVEAPDGLYVPMASRVADGPDGTVKFEVDLSRGDSARDLKGKTLTLTLVGDAGATEAAWTVP
jgi:DsbC/DsbD-like thiol-disulfide interchange protein